MRPLSYLPSSLSLSSSVPSDQSAASFSEKTRESRPLASNWARRVLGKSSTVAEITALQGALQTIRNTLGDRAVSLTPDQRKTLVKMGDNTRAFCQQAVAGLQANLGNMLPDLDVPGLVQDYTGYAALEPIVAEFEAVGELLDDTLKALSSDVMTSSIIGVTFLKALNKINPEDAQTACKEPARHLHDENVAIGVSPLPFRRQPSCHSPILHHIAHHSTPPEKQKWQCPAPDQSEHSRFRNRDARVKWIGWSNRLENCGQPYVEGQ